MKITVIAAILWLVAAPSPFAQQSTGTIAGRLLDQQGAAVAEATVTTRNPGTGFIRAATSDNMGMYRLAGLPVAAYEVAVEKPGFATIVRKDVAVNVAETQ